MSINRTSFLRSVYILIFCFSVIISLGASSSEQYPPGFKYQLADSFRSQLNPSDGNLNPLFGVKYLKFLDVLKGIIDQPLSAVFEQPNQPSYPPVNWYSLNKGLSWMTGERHVYVSVIKVFGTDLYAGGNFLHTVSGPSNVGYIARFDKKNGTWHSLANEGLSGFWTYDTHYTVSALEMSGNNLFVGGRFTATGDETIMDLGNIAKYNTGTETWYALPNHGLNGTVSSMTANGDNLFVGGEFISTEDGIISNLNHIARYDIKNNTWNALSHNGLSGGVSELELFGNDLYIGGVFTQTVDGSLQGLDGLVRYNIETDSWGKINTQGLQFFSPWAVSGVDLYGFGTDNQSGDRVFVRYDTQANTWQTWPHQGVNRGETSLVVSGDDLYVGGWFTETSDGTLKDLGYLYRFNTKTGTFHALPNKGLNVTFLGGVYTLEVFGNNLYVGGHFYATGDNSVQDLNLIAGLALDTPIQVLYYPFIYK